MQDPQTPPTPRPLTKEVEDDDFQRMKKDFFLCASLINTNDNIWIMSFLCCFGKFFKNCHSNRFTFSSSGFIIRVNLIEGGIHTEDKLIWIRFDKITYKIV